MARSKKVEVAQELDNAVPPQEPQAGQPASHAPGSSEPPEARKSAWLARFSSWGDHEAGVNLIEDRQNRRMTIKFDEKPSEAVREVMKRQHGYQYDPEDQVWYKKINSAKARQARTEADQMAFEVANMIREEKGLEQKKSFSLGM